MGKRKEVVATGPRCPPQLVYLYAWFCELSGTRGSGGFGPSRLSALDLLAGVWLFHRVIPAPWEAAALVQLDSVWLAAQAEVMRASKPPPDKPTNRTRK